MADLDDFKEAFNISDKEVEDMKIKGFNLPAAKTDKAMASMLRGMDKYIAESGTTNPVVLELRAKIAKRT